MTDPVLPMSESLLHRGGGLSPVPPGRVVRYSPVSVPGPERSSLVVHVPGGPEVPLSFFTQSVSSGP